MRVLTRTRRLTAELHARRAWFARPAPQCGATSGALELHTFAHSMSKLEQLARLERLRAALAKGLACRAGTIDLIDLKRAPLSLCIAVAEEGKVLKGGQSLELFRFYQRAWSGQEEFHFRKAHGL